MWYYHCLKIIKVFIFNSFFLNDFFFYNINVILNSFIHSVISKETLILDCFKLQKIISFFNLKILILVYICLELEDGSYTYLGPILHLLRTDLTPT